MKRIIVLMIMFLCSPVFAGFGGFLQANTAVDVIVGPFVDDTDGKTAETGLTVTQAEVRLSKNGANTAQKNEATSLTHDELGNYVCKLDTTDTNTEGILTLMVHESGALPIKMDYQILAQAAYISLTTAKDTGYMGVDVEEVDGTDQTANDNGADINAILTDTGTDGVVVASINTDAVDADALNTDAVTEIWATAMSDLAAGAPSATATIKTAINYLYEAWRNGYKTDGTNSEIVLYKDDGITPLVEADIADDGTDFTRQEYGAPD